MKKDINEHLGLLENAMRGLQFESSAYYIIQSFMLVRKPSEELKRMFQAWIISSDDETEMQLALHKHLLEMSGEEKNEENLRREDE